MLFRCLVCCLFFIVHVGAAELVPLAGDAVLADQINVGRDAVELDGQRFALADCDSLLLSAEAKPALPSHHDVVVVLLDGSWLPAASIRQSAEADAIDVTTVLGEYTLALGDQVIAWGSAAWLDSLGKQDSDVLLLASDDGTSALNGQLNGIDSGSVSFESEHLGELAQPLNRVAGLALAIGHEPIVGVHVAFPLITNRPPLHLRAVKGGWALGATDLMLERVPTQRGMILGGNRTWLSEATVVPETLVQEGAFGTVWPYKVNANLDGSPLILGGVRYPSGVTVHSRTVIEWQLDGKYDYFQTMIGISDLVEREGDCVVVLKADNKTLWQRQSLRGDDAPQLLQFDVAGAQRLRLEVDFGNRYDIGDHVALAGAWLRKAK